MESTHNLIALREKIGILESKKDQVIKTLDVQVERAMAVAEIPVFSNKSSDDMCKPFLDLLDKHIQACTDVFQYINRIFGELRSSLQLDQFSHLGALNPSDASTSITNTSQQSFSAELHQQTSGLGASALDKLKDTVMTYLSEYSHEIRKALVEDISSQVMGQLRNVLCLHDRGTEETTRARDEETEVKQPFPATESPSSPDTPSQSQPKQSPRQSLPTSPIWPTTQENGAFAGSFTFPRTISSMTNTSLSSNEPSRPPSARREGENARRERRSTGREEESARGEEQTPSKNILHVPTTFVGEAYPPSVLFHGQITHSLEIHGAIILKCDDFYVLQEEWYEKENGIFTAPVTGSYRFFVDIKAWYKQKEEKKRSTCLFRWSRNIGKPLSWASCELISLWWENDAKSSNADEEVLLHEGEEIYFMASTTIGLWETVASDVTLMIVHAGT